MTDTLRPILLAGGRLIDPSRRLDEKGDLLVVDGKIESVGGKLGAVDGAEVIDCSDAIVSPGFIDVHCHLRAVREQQRQVDSPLCARCPIRIR